MENDSVAEQNEFELPGTGSGTSWPQLSVMVSEQLDERPVCGELLIFSEINISPHTGRTYSNRSLVPNPKEWVWV
jgi:hypothetical protein